MRQKNPLQSYIRSASFRTKQEIQTNMGQHNSKTYRPSQEAPRMITIRRRNTAPYAPLPPAYGQREPEGITTPTCLERTYVASYLSDPMPNTPSSFTFDEARTVKESAVRSVQNLPYTRDQIYSRVVLHRNTCGRRLMYVGMSGWRR